MIEAIFVVISLKMGVAAAGEAPHVESPAIAEVGVERAFAAEQANVNRSAAQVPWGLGVPGMPVTSLDNGNWPL